MQSFLQDLNVGRRPSKGKPTVDGLGHQLEPTGEEHKVLRKRKDEKLVKTASSN